ncbi:NlpC/P60 family protein [Streptomyces sp. LX-29]|uniref:C40 family peptidase n=1 Tax=Streptomyces sp. LX-29 TaxID=2900152 RepID=UPI00240DB6F3|nr:C40 family peptidase [Streptomyces sp. LX-29]WFB08930.1 NlpC/P60 family protein [Streptomyces sp. LX-29]
MASHRKPRPRISARIQSAPAGRRTAVGVTTAALASVTLLSQAAPSAQAAPRAPEPTMEEVKERVDTLYREAGTATQEYNAAEERADKQRATVDRMIEDAARRTEKLNEARRVLGAYAAAQYRHGGVANTATLLLASDPQDFFDRSHLMDRLTGRQKEAVDDFRVQTAEAATQRAEAARSLTRLSESQKRLRAKKETVQGKLAEARTLLSRLTAEEKARLAAIERRKEAEARRKAAELAEKERQREEAERRRQQPTPDQDAGGDSGTGTDTGSGSGSGSDSGSHATKAERAIAFARAQLGKPYVWGATGPGSYDCSGLTQAAWKSAEVTLPRTTWDQVKVGQRVATSELIPGDLVFFYDDISHVGLYIGDGMMIHAPKPGDVVKIAPITEMPIYGNVRPA